MTLAVAAPDVRVYLGDTSGGDIVPASDQVTYLIAQELNWTAGGQQLDNATFLWNLGDSTAPITQVQNITTPTNWNRQIEVRLYDANGSTFTPLFWGDLTGQQITPNSAVVTASVFPYHFGDVLDGPMVYDTISEDDVTLPEPIEFNPLIDGIIEGNMSSRERFGKHHVWGDPESFRTDEAETYQAETLSNWTLQEAVKAVCWRCNPDETYIKNPSDFSAFDGYDPEPQNVVLPWGKYLPEYLDGLLHPLGFNWCLSLSQSGTSTEKRITIFRRGDGPELTLPMQAIGNTLDLGSTECDSFDLSTDVGGLANEIKLRGSRYQYEVTIDLYRGWVEADDSQTESDLDKGVPTSNYETKPYVWRLFVANEAGDYNSTRSTTQPIPAAPRDWSEYDVLVPRRRQIEDCLTYADDGKRRPPFLEWSDDDGSTWQPVPPSWSYTIYQTQMAIEFVGDRPPAELIAAGDNAKLRVTCTMTADVAIEETAAKRTETPNGRKVVAGLDVSDRYHYRQIAITGSLASQLNTAGTDPADTRDDTTALTSFAEQIRGDEESARMSGSFGLIGLNLNYWIGDLLTEISGRAISLNRNSAGGTPKYLQVMGVSWYPQQQRTRLVTVAPDADVYVQG